MEREYALETYQKTAEEIRKRYRESLGPYLTERAKQLETLVKTSMDLLGERMGEMGKEYVSYLYLSVLKTDLLFHRSRLFAHALDVRWYLDEEPAETDIDAGDLLDPLYRLWDELTEAARGSAGAVNRYDVQNLVFEELKALDGMVSGILRWRLRDWEEKKIFSGITLAPCWMLKWGEYRDQTEMLVQTQRVEKEAGAWEKSLKKASRKPETMVFGYWYQETCQGTRAKEIDMRFTVFESCRLQDLAFDHCNLEGSRFVGSHLKDCSFSGCGLQGADFTGCGLEQVSFEGADLTGAIFPAEAVPFLHLDADQLQTIQLKREEEA